jgi:hypothetical protein
MLEYLTETSDQYSISVSENGWTDDHLCRDWFVKVFVPYTKECDVHDEGILTIWDGHHSHETLPLIELALQENITLFSLLSHTTHHTQPLDVGIFGPAE